MELTVAATEVMMAGESSERAAALAERAIEALRADPILAVVVGFASHCLIVADRLDDADRILSATVDDARRHRANYRVGPLLIVPLRSALPRGGPPRSRRGRQGGADRVRPRRAIERAGLDRDARAGADRARRARGGRRGTRQRRRQRHAGSDRGGILGHAGPERACAVAPRAGRHATRARRCARGRAAPGGDARTESVRRELALAGRHRLHPARPAGTRARPRPARSSSSAAASAPRARSASRCEASA